MSGLTIGLLIGGVALSGVAWMFWMFWTAKEGFEHPDHGFFYGRPEDYDFSREELARIARFQRNKRED